MERIAVWNTAFLGDAVLTLPLLRVLHAAWPEAELDFYVRGGLAGLFAAQPELAHVYAYDKRGTGRGLGGFRLLGLEAASRRYDLWVDAHLSLRSSVMARLSGARRRIGYAEAALGWWMFTDTVSRQFEKRQEVERLLALLEPLNLPPALTADSLLIWPEIILPISAHQEADRLLAGLRPGPLLGVHPGSVWPTKRWTPEGFAYVMRRGLEAGANVVLLAAPEEKTAAEEVLQLSGMRGANRLLDLSGKTSLPGLAAVLGRLQCYVTNDSGPMHLAWAQRTPVTAIFGPTVCSLGFEPRGNSTVIETEIPCRPCGLHGHKQCPKKHFDCMRTIDPEMVWQDVLHKLYPWKAGAEHRISTSDYLDEDE